MIVSKKYEYASYRDSDIGQGLEKIWPGSFTYWMMTHNSFSVHYSSDKVSVEEEIDSTTSLYVYIFHGFLYLTGRDILFSTISAFSLI